MIHSDHTDPDSKLYVLCFDLEERVCIAITSLPAELTTRAGTVIVDEFHQ